ncbi:hypothetical protein LCGC14_1122330 [marine sediment metagenome]|uniref:Leucine-rich repeat domain-containing protein n=1 Tax=marine sediment metagenome TaxID=412755 RepID=A0A0F9Q9D6_9ZZZZ
MEFEVNRYIKLKLEDEKTNIYINDEFFSLCKHLLISIPRTGINSFDSISSIDEVTSNQNLREQNQNEISPEEEFMGHCSNLQAWVENDYNTEILHMNIAFPLLKKLAEVGVPKARGIFKEEIVSRFLRGYEPVLIFLIRLKFLEVFNDEELKFLWKELEFKGKNKLTEVLVKELKRRQNKKYQKRLYKMLIFLDKELVTHLPYVEYEENKVFVNDPLNLTRRREEYRIKTIREIKGLDKLHQLRSLMIQDHAISKLSGLEKLESLEFLDLSRNNIVDLSGLKKCSKLKTLILNNNNINKVNNLELLSHLEYLDLRFNKIAQISGLEDLKNLKRLELNGNSITRIEGLDNLESLEMLNFSDNEITVIEGLDRLVSLKDLNLVNNNIQKINGLDNLEKLEALNIYGNENIKNLFKRFLYDGRIYVEFSKNCNAG